MRNDTCASDWQARPKWRSLLKWCRGSGFCISLLIDPVELSSYIQCHCFEIVFFYLMVAVCFSLYCFTNIHYHSEMFNEYFLYNAYLARMHYIYQNNLFIRILKFLSWYPQQNVQKFIEHQISALEWFLKDPITLASDCFFYCFFDQVNVALGYRKILFFMFTNFHWLNFWMVV